MIFLYRKNGGYVEGMSSDAAAYAGADAALFATVTDPPTPDGLDLGVLKVYDGANLRNATVGEISNYPAVIVADTTINYRNLAKQRLQNDVVLRKLLGAMVATILQSVNQVRTQPTTTFAAVTQQQAINAILNNIDSGSFD